MSAKMLAWLGLAIAAAGVLVGFIPVSAAGVGCGSAWVKSNDAAVSDLTQTLGTDVVQPGGLFAAESVCDSARSSERLIVWPLVAIGAAALVVGAVGVARQPSAPAA